MKTSINERVKVLRTHLNLTQQEFSSLIGMTNTQLSRIENGNAEPHKSTLAQILKKVEVTKEWLLDGKGELKAQIKSNTDENTNPWKDEAYFAVKEENQVLKKELERLWQMVSHFTSGAKPNFLKASENTYGFKMFPGMEQLNTVSGAMGR